MSWLTRLFHRNSEGSSATIGITEEWRSVTEEPEASWRTVEGDALIKAVRDGNASGVREAIERGTDLDSKDGFGNPALVVAVEEHHLEIIEMLLAHGADPDSFGRVNTALTAAIEHGVFATPEKRVAPEKRKEAVRLLINAGADVNWPRPADLWRPLEVAEWAGYPEILEMIREASASVAASPTALPESIEADGPSAQGAVTGLGESSDPAELGAMLERLAAEDASVEGLARARALVEAGADVDYQGEYTPLASAVRSSNVDLVRLLVAARADPTLGHRGSSAFDYCGHPRVEDRQAIVEELRNARPRRLDGNTLVAAAAFGATSIVRQAIDAGVDVNSQDMRGWSAMMIASDNGHLDIFDLLLKNGASLPR